MRLDSPLSSTRTCGIICSIASTDYAFIELAPSFNLLQFILELCNPLAFLPMAILRSIPMDLLAVTAAVAEGLASLAELAIGVVQQSAANLAALS